MEEKKDLLNNAEPEENGITRMPEPAPEESQAADQAEPASGADGFGSEDTLQSLSDEAKEQGSETSWEWEAREAAPAAEEEAKPAAEGEAQEVTPAAEEEAKLAAEREAEEVKLAAEKEEDGFWTIFGGGIYNNLCVF